jgi:prophage regulatory protein
MQQLPETGFVRLTQILGNPKADPPIPAIVPVSKSSWWAGVKSGRFPKPVKLGPRTTDWRVEEIRALSNGTKAEGGVQMKQTHKRKRPDSHVGRGDNAEQVVPQVQLNHSTTSQPLPCLDAVRASVKAAIVEAARLSAVDATRVPDVIKLLSLEDA